MSVFDGFLRWLGLLGPQGAIVLDTINRPVADVDVQIFSPAGVLLDTTQTDEEGIFTFSGGVSCPTIFDLVIDPANVAARFRLINPIGPLQLFVVRPPILLTDTVGITGANAPVDLKRLQDHLRFVGRLTDADVAAEPMDETSADPIAAADVPRLMTALYRHLRAGGGGAPMQFGAGSRSLAIVNALPPAVPLVAPVPAALAGWVGDAPGQIAPAPANNVPADVRLVQDRLYQLGFLPLADYAAERVDPATAANPVPVADLTQTIAAIKTFNKDVVGSLQHAIFGNATQERLLRDPYTWGQLPLALTQSVGAGGANRSRDVRALQDRLNELGHLLDANYNAERVNVPAAGNPDPPIADAALAQTIAAIQAVHVQLLGAAAPGSNVIQRDDPGLVRINRPVVVDIFEVGDEQPPVVRPAAPNRRNHPPHVRAVQDRLRLLGYLSDVAHALEQVNPFALAAVPAATIVSTCAAIRAIQADLGIAVPGQLPVAGGELLLPAHRPSQITLTSAVGQGQPNRPADVRPIQDRLRALRFLAAADYTAEQVDPTLPAVAGPLVATFAAISAVRQRIFGLPAATANPWTARPVIAPDSNILRFLNNPLFFGLVEIRLGDSVGELGFNRLADLQPVQRRLNELALLSDADLAAETPAAGRVERMRDEELPQTIRALRTLRGAFLSEAPAVARIQAVNPATLALGRPYKRLRVRLDLSGSVGTGGTNAQLDVVATRRRLRDIRQLAAADFEAEPPIANPVDFLQLPSTQAAINVWRAANDGPNPANPPIGPFDTALRRLEWPVLPIPVAMGIAHDVGAGAAGAARNRRADVLMVQDRLHELDVLPTGDYLRERQIADGLATIAGAQMPQTVQAIFAFQHTAAGGNDGVVGDGGHTERVLRDPAFGTALPTNPDTGNRHTGPAMPAQFHPVPARHREIVAIITAIERHEAGGAVGEVPAILRNGSQVPASFGKGQTIAGTAVGALQANVPTADFYDLTAAELAGINAQFGTAGAEYARIFGLVAAPGVTEANLVAAIAADQAANGAAFRVQTGLGPTDQALMFRTAQLRRHVRAFIDGQLGANEDAQRVAAVANIAAFDAGADRVANRAALNMKRSDVQAYLRRAIDAEHRAGFLMRVLFRMDDGIAVKAAMTDDSGFKLGRFVIRDNFVSVLGQAGAAALTRQQRAQITARIHNSGPAGLAGFVAAPATAVNAYVNDVMAHWMDPGP